MSKKQIFSLFIAVNFLLVSCSSSSSSKKKSVAAQRAVETREYAVDTKSLMTSSIGAFQDLGFTIDTLSEEFGLITASKVEEEEEEDDEGFSAGKILGALLIIGALIALDDILPDSDDSGGGGGSTKTVIKDYKLTATLTVKPISETEPVLSSLRINFGGSERKRSMRFFKEFFAAIDKSLFLDENLDAAEDVDLEE
ncbi:MAG: hypothetical protein P8L43_03090 [Candidatus Marinimicrobia bacterium]|jgi:hypothetical protein|nr:hypothetical protein [Candidatus Neomarinimicrobiota bacterium]|tara:strand:- start:552 stop:1142 length:591 start_codon:yes stop_codon:yes gene_type:complete